MRLKRIICSLLISTLLINCHGLTNASEFDDLDLLCAQKIDMCFSLPGNSEVGKQVGIASALGNGTFLLGEAGSICYQVDEYGNILKQFVLCHPDHDANAVQIKAGAVFDNRFVFAVMNYDNDSSYIATCEPDSTVIYSDTIQAAIEDVITLDDGLLLCGSIKVTNIGQTNIRPWAAKINAAGTMMWEYTEDDINSDTPKGYKKIAHCVAEKAMYYVVCVENIERLYWTILQLDRNGCLINEFAIPVDKYQPDGDITIRDAVIQDGVFLLALSIRDNLNELKSSILAVKEEREIWAYDVPDNHVILSVAATQNGYAYTSATFTETFLTARWQRSIMRAS